MPPVTTADLDCIVQEVVAERGTLDRATLDESWRRIFRLIAERTDLGSDEAVVRPLLEDIRKGMSQVVQYVAFPNDAAHTFPEPADRVRLVSYFTHAEALAERIRGNLALLPVPDGERRVWLTRNLDGMTAFIDRALQIIRDYSAVAQSGTVQGQPVGVAFTTAGFKDLSRAYQFMLGMVLGKEREEVFLEQFNACMRAMNQTAQLLTPTSAASN